MKKARKNKDGSEKTPATAALVVKQGTYVKMNGETKLYAAKETLDLLGYVRTVEIWTEAKVKKAAGAKQVITR